MRDACYRVQGELARVEASPDLVRWRLYFCLECGARTIFRCGDERVPHFAHSPYDPRSASCPFRSEPPDTQVGRDGHFFVQHGDQAPIRAAQPCSIPAGPKAFNRAAGLKLWLTAERKGPQATWVFSFGLGLPKLGVDTPDLRILQSLHLAVRGVTTEGSQAWRLWPSPGLDPVPVPLMETYELEIDPCWPASPPWRKEALEAAHVELLPSNAFLLEEGDHGCLQGRLATSPVTLPLGSHLLNLTLNPEMPPATLSPVRLGTCMGEQGTWYIWELFLPAGLEGFDKSSFEWLEIQDWHISEEKTVRVVSPPPLAFVGLVPIYPSQGKGWALLETRPDINSSSERRAWLMNAPVPGYLYQLPTGRSPGLAQCQATRMGWVDIPYPQLILLKDGEPFDTFQLRGKPVLKVIAGIDVRRLSWVIRSSIPLRVLAGPPGRLGPLVWQPEGRLNGLEDGIRSAIERGAPYMVQVHGLGIPRMILTFTPAVNNAPRFQGTDYHLSLRQKSGWPSYTHSIAPEVPR